jgi:hypothetical protein
MRTPADVRDASGLDHRGRGPDGADDDGVVTDLRPLALEASAPAERERAGESEQSDRAPLRAPGVSWNHRQASLSPPRGGR